MANSTTIKTTSVSAFEHFLYITRPDGTQVEIKEIDNPEDYSSKVELFSKVAAKGAAKGSTLYAVAKADFVAKRRVSAKESIESMEAAGLSPAEILAKLKG